MHLPSELIKKKKLGRELTREEIFWLIESFTNNSLPDYQMAAWAMAVWFRGMTSREIADLTIAMRDSGRVFDFKKIKAPRVDKHSTGGVGDKTSLLIGPILEAAEVHVPMIAGRGLGHTGGTLDKLKSIPGFRTDLTREDFISRVENNFFALMGQTADICPADRKLYALRDVTSTVDSLPLICGSIMSKKLAEDLTGLVLDIKFGSGAFMKSLPQARELASLLKSTGEHNGVQVTAVLSNMNEMLGRYAGNSLEVLECLHILRGEKKIENDFDFYSQTRELSLQLSAHMLISAGKKDDFKSAYSYAESLLASGRALDRFMHFIERQGPSKIEELPLPNNKTAHIYTAPRAGYLSFTDTEKIGLACVTLGAGRQASADIIDPTAGIECLCRCGWKVEVGQPLFRLFKGLGKNFDDACQLLNEAVQITDSNETQTLPLVAEVL